MSLAAIPVDLCGSCSGVWFDAGELGTLQRFRSVPRSAHGPENEELAAADLVLTVLF